MTNSEKPSKFTPPKDQYPGRISEVVLGKNPSDGGTRYRSLKIGGETAPPFHFFEGETPNKPVISHDVFDTPIPLPGHVKEHFGDAMNNPVEWARLRATKYYADCITLHMVSTDPKNRDTPVSEAAKIIEDVLQAVKLPLIIGGSGNPKKDPELLEKAAEVCSGERILLSSVDPNMDYKRVAKAAVKHGHAVLSLIPMNPDEMRRFNKNLMKQGLKEEDIVMDPFTGGVGYGIEYSVSAMQRIRLAGLNADPYLAMPIASATSNAWSAREAWMRNEAWGPRELRGPLWESITALTALLSGADLLMMLHPRAIEETEKFIKNLMEHKTNVSVCDAYADWVNI